MSDMQPPRKPLRRLSKLALGFLIALIGVVTLIVASVFLFGCGSATGAPPNQSGQAALAATANANATNAAQSLTALSNDLTQTAMTPDTSIPTPTPTPAPQNGVGSSQTSGPWSVTINSVTPTSGGEFDSPHAGNHFILINFTAHNNDIAAHDMSPVWFSLRDSQGNTYDLAYISVPHDPRGTVVPGQQLRGDLSYELPLSLHQVTLQFDPPEDTDNSQIVQWTLSI